MPKYKTARTRSTKRRSAKSLSLYIILGLFLMAVIWWITKPEMTGNQDDKEPSKPLEDSIKVLEGETILDGAIRKSASKLGIPTDAIKRKQIDSQVLFKLPIDRSNLDLSFANMIVKGQAELVGGELIRGVETGSTQSLVFKLPNSSVSYKVDIYYDADTYQIKDIKKKIAIVVDDFGSINGELLEGYFELDPNVCFAIFPNMQATDKTIELAQRQGRETLIHVPMEPIGYPQVDPGRGAILIQMSEIEIERRISRYIDQMPYCKGINNHMGSLATTEENVMVAVMRVLKEKDKYFLDSRTSNVSVAYQVAQKAHIPAYQNKMFLDSPNISDETFEAKFKQVMTLSQSNQPLIVITHCHTREKLDYLRRFITRLKESGFEITPLSELKQQNTPTIE